MTHSLPRSFQSIYSWSRILYNLHLLERNTWLPSSELEKLQVEKLRKVVKYAYENVAFYHQRFNLAKIKPDDIKSIEDLKKIPILTKLEVQENFSSLISKKIDTRNCKTETTSGTTGTPLSIIADKNASYILAASKLRHQLEDGSDLLRDKYVLLLPVRGLPRKRTLLGSFLNSLGFLSRYTVDTQDPIENTVQRLADFKPDIVDSLPSFLLLLIKEMQKRESFIRPKLIFTSGELLDAESRKLIASAFNADIFDVYGCTEVGNIAWECPEHVGYHMNTDMAVTEFIRNEEHVSAGENGEILLTSLWNFAMPLIRYKIGDVGTPSNERCPCGRGFPLMRVIEGRFDDFIALPSGRIISPYVISRCFANVRGITEYRVVQEADKRLTIQIVLTEGHEGELFSQLRDSFTKELGEKIASVRGLKRTSVAIPHAGGKYEPKTPCKILGGLVCLQSGWKKGISDCRLKNALKQVRDNKQIDMICCLNAGSFLATYEKNKISLRKSTADSSLVFFFIGLLSALQSVATVCAMDFNAYAKTLKNFEIKDA